MAYIQMQSTRLLPLHFCGISGRKILNLPSLWRAIYPKQIRSDLGKAALSEMHREEGKSASIKDCRRDIGRCSRLSIFAGNIRARRKERQLERVRRYSIPYEYKIDALRNIGIK